MIKTIVVCTLLAIFVGGVAYGAYHHSRFIKLGGQRGFAVLAPAAQTDAMRGPYRAMQLGYGVSFACVALMALVTAIWGPVVI
jgi:hypothetical protein